MRYHGFQFRAARAATALPTRDICELAEMSMQTLNRIERAGLIEVSDVQRQAGLFERTTIERLVSFFQSQGVTFVAASGGKPPGVLFDESKIAVASKPSNTVAAAPRRSARKASGKASRRKPG